MPHEEHNGVLFSPGGFMGEHLLRSLRASRGEVHSAVGNSAWYQAIESAKRLLRDSKQDQENN